MLVFETDGFDTARTTRIEADDPVLEAIFTGWSEALKDTLERLPSYTI